MSNTKQRLLENYTTKLLKDTILNDIHFNKQDISELFIDIVAVRYMSLSQRTPDDLSVIACSYNLYYYKEGERYPIYSVDEDVLKNGQFYAAVVLSNADTEVLYSHANIENKDTVAKSESVNISEQVTDEVVKTVTGMLSTIRGVKLPNKRMTLNGIGQHPDVPFSTVQPIWKKALNEALSNVYAHIYDILIDDIDLDKAMTYFISLKSVEVEKRPEGTWILHPTVDVISKDGVPILMHKQPVLQTKFIYNNERLKKELQESAIQVLESHTQNLKPENFGNTTLTFKPFYNVPSVMEQLAANSQQTSYVFQRIAKVLESHKESNTIQGVKQAGPYLTMKLFSEPLNEYITGYFGGEGFVIVDVVYNRKGNEEQSDKKLVYKRLNVLFGPNRLWMDMLSCYDFRRKL